MMMLSWKRHTISLRLEVSRKPRGTTWSPASSLFRDGCISQACAVRKLHSACRPLTPHCKIVLALSPRLLPRRTFLLDGVSPILVPPIAFVGLFILLWTYKCFMMILFQDKIIYMPYVPPFSRSEKIEDYVDLCKPVLWRKLQIKSLDNTKIALCIGNHPGLDSKSKGEKLRHVIICYFQGNGSSLPPRLPMLSNVLKCIDGSRDDHQRPPTQYTIVALSYRGYWTSSGRASQAGIELDASAVLNWISEEFRGDELNIILWGQSIGAGVASTAAAAHGVQVGNRESGRISGLILETPFSSIRSMLSAIYPQKWLPYGYLWPFLWNHWDSEQALKRIARQKRPPRVLLMAAMKDEIVPPPEADKLERLCNEVGLDVERQDIQGALHTEATSRRAGQAVVAKFVLDVAARRDSLARG